MRFAIEKEGILKELAKIQNIVERKTSIPIISNAFIDISDNMMTIIATDMEIEMKITIPCETKEEGKICLPAKKLYEIIRELPENSIEFTLKDNQRVDIQCESILFTITGSDTSEYPKFSNIDTKNLFEISPQKLNALIEKTQFSMSNDEKKHNLNGILFDISKNENNNLVITTVSTDTHRLSITKEEIEEYPDEIEETKVIIPKKGITEIKKISENCESTIKMGFQEKSSVVIRENTEIIIRNIDADFPEYQRVIPETTEKFAIIEREPFLRTLRRVSTLSSEKYRGIKTTFEKGSVNLYINNMELGEATESVPAEYDGEEETIIYNSKYLLDSVFTYQSPQVRFQFKDDQSPGIISPTDHPDSKTIIMPMRI
ncbi:MAG: DNA polymerase III subunit beta [Deltaproteobacteria bacterium]|nr:DNA polymerase III subunit beta [Deltaproteobacteria bacterium]